MFYYYPRFGRKYTIISALAIASISCIIVAFIPTDKGKALVIVRIIIGMIGKCGVSVSFDAIYTWSVELYPTVVRAQGIGLLQITSRIGAAGAPWVAKYLKTVHVYAPFLVMGSSSMISVFTLFYLPETKGQKTAETLDEAPAKQLSVEYKREEGDVKANVNLAYEEMGDLPPKV
eukprot:Seg2251.2 transcript_id=Seg2251.2/GoldUCD/mRNA.D3Y31 product="Solute carrier family 22 member 13" protein_id=Seg2251.2/GoldUCD/D3Y31